MRPVTRNTILAILVVVVLLLALGAFPSLLRSGDPYYVTAEATNETGPSVNATELPPRQYRYIDAALADGRSDAYYDGPFGFKEGFSHSPFDEFDAIGQRYASATAEDGSVVYVSENGTRYRLEIIREASG